MPCRLCLQDKPLRWSHIVPEFMYERIYNPKHQIFAIKGETRIRIQQKGARERLLCFNCEQQFSRYENYAAPAFFRRTFKDEEQQGRVVILRGLDYKLLKLFFLSVLWRFGVTSIDLLKGAMLGPHEERLRQMLINEDSGDELIYPCTVTEVSPKGTSLDGWILPPRRSRPHGIWVWNTTLSRFLLGYFVASHPAPAGVRPIFLNPAGTMRIYRADIREIPSLIRYAEKLTQVDF